MSILLKITWFEGGLIAAISMLLSSFFPYFKKLIELAASKKKKINETSYMKGFEKYDLIQASIHRLVKTQDNPYCNIVSIVAVRNGGDTGDPTEPKEFKILNSTDYKTKLLWSDWTVMESALVKIHGLTMKEGHWPFQPSTLEDATIQDWYNSEERKIKHVIAYRIALNTSKGLGLVLYANYTESHAINAKASELIRVEIRKLQKLFEPEGWVAKKNYLTR